MSDNLKRDVFLCGVFFTGTFVVAMLDYLGSSE
jgi:hypothetical protein